MSIRIYNSLTKHKEDLVPISGKIIKMYSCGVTVYDKCHLGHARSLFVFDVIRRYLTHRGYDVRFVRNITDVDDKIIARSKELNKSFEAVVEENIAAYQKDLKSLNIQPADLEPRATENIEDMVRIISGLIDKEYAYESNGDVYFDVRNFSQYGKLSGQSIDKMLEAVRVELEVRKKDPLDFALWKSSKEGEPSWDSPWGKGRPGWHIECSCMSMKHLDCETLDIHAGGRDLIFPHHENEVAQSEGFTGKPFARYWMHHGLITIAGQKMAKSLGNFITVDQALGKYNVNELKLFFCSSHYASSIDFSDEKMIEFKKQKRSFDEFFDKVNTWQLYKGKVNTEVTQKDQTKIAEISHEFLKAMDEDFNTPEALAVIFALIDLGARFISSDKEEGFRKVYDHLTEIFNILGLKVPERFDVSDGLLRLVSSRYQSRVDKDFKTADEIRQQIEQEYSVQMIDTMNGFAFIRGVM